VSPSTLTTPPSDESTFPMRVASRLTGVSPERLRAWESRHDAIQPIRTPGGSRRYSASDLDRIRALRRLTEGGCRIAELADLDTAELLAQLEAEAGEGQAAGTASIGCAIYERARPMIEALDAAGLRTFFGERIERLGVVGFARTEALALAVEVGERWERGELAISAEHLATDVLRSLLMEKLRAWEADGLGPRILFATPSGEHHDVGLLVAALVAAAQGASVLFVGADVPDADLAATACATRADVLALGFVVMDRAQMEARLAVLRSQLPDRVALWLGGRGIEGLPPIQGVDRVGSFDRLEAFVLEARGAADAQGASREVAS
jgi:DNA-binding transcriptional MerR regulator